MGNEAGPLPLDIFFVLMMSEFMAWYALHENITTPHQCCFQLVRSQWLAVAGGLV